MYTRGCTRTLLWMVSRNEGWLSWYLSLSFPQRETGPGCSLAMGKDRKRCFASSDETRLSTNTGEPCCGGWMTHRPGQYCKLSLLNPPSIMTVMSKLSNG